MDFIRDNPGITDMVRNIAVINVKKLPGFTRTYGFGGIYDAYCRHKELLLKQIEVYNPDIVIGGSTLSLFYNDQHINKAEEEKKFGCVEYVEKHSRLYISAYHPAQTQVTRENYVNDIVSLAKDWTLKKGLFP